MYGRNNIFSQGSSSYNSNNNYGNNNNNSNNYSSNNNNSNNNSYRGNNRAMGSQRLDYKYQQPPSYITSFITQWKDQPPSSIVCREQTLHLSTSELRIEDYFLMRKKQLKSSQEDRLREAIRHDSFNEDILKFEFDRPPPVSDQRPLDMDAIRSGRSNQGNDYRSGGGYGSGNSGGYNTRGNSSNIFSNGSNGGSNNVSNNIFSRNSGGGGNNNVFDNDRGRNNSYGNNNNSYGNNNNSYGNNNSSYGNNNNNSGNNNIFSSNRGGGNSNNIFGNGNNNNSQNGSSGIFGNNNNSRGGSNNIFNGGNNNNNSSSNNIFNNNRNGGSNNIFNNTSGNNRSNNLFGNNSGGNNLFGNNSNNNNNSGISVQFMMNLQHIFQQNNKIISNLSNKIYPEREKAQRPLPPPSPFDALLNSKDNDIDRFLHSPKKRHDDQPLIIEPKWLQQYKNLSQSQLSQSTHLRNTSIRPLSNPAASRNMNNQSIRIFNNQPNNSKIIPNLPQKRSQIRGTESRLLSNKSEEMQRSHISQVQRSNIKKISLCEYDAHCQCEIQLDIQWQDDEYGQIPQQPIKTTIRLPFLKPNDKEWQRQTVLKLKQEFNIIRSDANLNITLCKQKQTVDPEYYIKGRLSQRIVNLPSQYRVCYSQIRNYVLHNLVISNKCGSIAWERPVNAKEIDFTQLQVEPPFEIGQHKIICDIKALNEKCRVQFVGLPKPIEAAFGSSAEQQQKTEDQFRKFIRESSNQCFDLQQMWKNKEDSGWTMLVNEFPPNEEAEA